MSEIVSCKVVEETHELLALAFLLGSFRAMLDVNLVSTTSGAQ